VEAADTAVVVGIAGPDVEPAVVFLHTPALRLQEEAATRICCAVVRSSEAEAADSVRVVWDP
jgi:hypothetical protein